MGSLPCPSLCSSSYVLILLLLSSSLQFPPVHLGSHLSSPVVAPSVVLLKNSKCTFSVGPALISHTLTLTTGKLSCGMHTASLELGFTEGERPLQPPPSF